MTQPATILEYIQAGIVDGKLPWGFSLAAFGEDDSPLRMADGAMDGINVYHMMPAELDEEAIRSLSMAMLTACSGNWDGADSIFADLAAQLGAINLVEPTQRIAAALSAEYDLTPLLDYATHLFETTADKEMAKLGILMHGMFSEFEGTPKEAIRTLGLCDEFTFFSAWAVSSWANGNQEIFNLAKATEGWGRIHCVELLDPETPEIREWLLHYGARNSVMPEYSALACLDKAGVRDLLATKIGETDFLAVTGILDAAATQDGPMENLPTLPDAQDIATRYLEQAVDHLHHDTVAACVAKLAELAEAEGWEDVQATCAQLVE